MERPYAARRHALPLQESSLLTSLTERGRGASKESFSLARVKLQIQLSAETTERSPLEEGTVGFLGKISARLFLSRTNTN